MAFSQARPDQGKLLRLASPLGEKEWGCLLQRSGGLGVLPLLSWNASRCFPQALPDPILERLRQGLFRNLQRNLLLSAELVELLKGLKLHGVEAIPFKGPVLAEALYGNVALRPCGDLDIVVHPRDLPKARELLLARGYRFKTNWTPRQRAFNRFSQCHDSLVREEGLFAVDLHWRLAPGCFSFLGAIEQMWERLETVSFYGEKIPSFSSEDLLIVLCHHGAKHRWERLMWICDLDQLIRLHPEWNWEKIIERAREIGEERILLLGLYLASSFWDVPLPRQLVQRFQEDPVVKSLGQRIAQRLFQNGGRGTGGFFNLLPYYWRMKERVSDRIRDSLFHAWTAVSPSPAEWERWPLPDPFFFLYYALRPLRLIGRSGRRLLKFSHAKMGSGGRLRHGAEAGI